MVLFFGSGDYAFVSANALLPFEAGENHDKLCKSSRSKQFIAAVAEANKSLAGKIEARPSKRPKSSRLLHFQPHANAIPTEPMNHNDSAEMANGAEHAHPESTPEESKATASASENTGDDVPDYEMLRQENMRRNKEILEVMRSIIFHG
jgi:hypothetical protein